LSIIDEFEGLDARAATFKRLLGEEGARRLADTFGGRRLYIPRSPGDHHPITVALGRARADALAAAFGGLPIDVPMLPAAQAEIRRLAAQGLSRSTIARHVRVTERWVYKTLAEGEKPPSRQGSLF